MPDKRPGAEKREALTAKQERFVEEYPVDWNATKAAMRAGYSEKTAYSIGHENLGKPHIAEAIAARMTALSERAGITTERVLAELARIGFSDVRKLFDDDGRLRHVTMLDDDSAACISAIEVETKRVRRDGEDKDALEAEGTLKIKLWDKKGALVDIGKHLGMFKDQVEHSGPNGGPIQVDDISNTEAARRIAFMLSAADRRATKH